MTNAQSVTQTPNGDFRFRKTNRVLKTAEFRKVYDNGTRFACPYFVAFMLRHPAEPALREDGPRIGFTIPRAVGKAVTRNRIRRRIREMLRMRLGQIDRSFDIVLNPRRIAAEASVEDLTRFVERLVAKCHV